MKKYEIIKLLEKVAGKTLDLPSENYKVKKCRVFPEEVYDDYVENILPYNDKKNFEQHLDGCLYCLLRLKQAFVVDEKVEKSFALSEIGQKKSLNRTLEHLDKLRRSRKSEKAAILLAAAGKQEGLTGISYGIAVDRSSGTGARMECSAWVSGHKTEEGLLDIRGIEVEAIKKDDLKVSLTSPLDLLEDQLEDLFDLNPFLRSFDLGRRDITVDVSQPEGNGYITDAQSLALSVIIAILNAITGKEASSSRAFSAGIRQNGRLKGVGSLAQKLEIARLKGIREFFLAEENRADLSTDLLENSELTLRFFPSLEKVIDYLGFFDFLKNVPLDKQKEKASFVDEPSRYYRIPECVEGWRFVVNIAKEKGLRDDLAIEICELTEDLCQMRQELKPLSTAFIIGQPSKIENILPDSPIKLKQNWDIFSIRKILVKLSSIVDGISMGFVAGTDSRVYSIRKLNIDLSGDFPINKLLGGLNRHYAIISRMTEAMIFLISSATNMVKVFADGAMVGRYKNGDWEPTDYVHFEKVLKTAAGAKHIPYEIVEKVGRTAIKMSDLNAGGIFVIFKNIDEMETRFTDFLERLSVAIGVNSILDLTDEELISFAKEDGAVLVDDQGNLHAFMAFLNPKHQDVSHYDLGMGTRHFVAQHLSKDINCFCIVNSQDGTITIYDDGEELFKI